MKKLRQLYYLVFPTYKRLAVGSFPYSLADKMLRDSENKPEEEKWRVCFEMEDRNYPNPLNPHVWLEQRKRIIE